MIGFYRWLFIIGVYLFSTLISIYFIESMYEQVSIREADNQNFDNVLMAKGLLYTLCFVPLVNTFYAAGLLYQFIKGFIRKK